MTYKRFTTKVKKLGLRWKFYDYGVSVYLADDDYIIATIYDTKRYYGVISFSSSLGATSNRLLYLCCELMRTPLENRGELQ